MNISRLARRTYVTITTIANDHINSAKYEFADPEHDRTQEEVVEKEVDPEAESVEWMKELEVDTRGAYLSSDANLNLIFANDPRLKRLFRQNDFDGKRYVFGNLPWRRVVKPEPVKNVDYSGVRNYLGCVYGITSSLKIDDAMALEFERNHFHPILDYLNDLKWDGIQRVDKLLIDYMGADDNIYSREAIRKMLVGAVARVMNPGVKFDLVLMLVGPQGSGKSTFIKKLGKSWFSDTFLTVQGKEALEQIQGAWLIEIAELSGLRKAEVESVKHFISKSEDSFRPAYARTSEIYHQRQRRRHHTQPDVVVEGQPLDAAEQAEAQPIGHQHGQKYGQSIGKDVQLVEQTLIFPHHRVFPSMTDR
jgi:predicted P-loop ATPase